MLNTITVRLRNNFLGRIVYTFTESKDCLVIKQNFEKINQET